MVDRWAVAEYEQIPAMEITSYGEWVKWDDVAELLLDKAVLQDQLNRIRGIVEE